MDMLGHTSIYMAHGEVMSKQFMCPYDALRSFFVVFCIGYFANGKTGAAEAVMGLFFLILAVYLFYVVFNFFRT